MEKETEITIRIGQIHLDIFGKFTPWFGGDEGEVIKNLALRWVEANIANPNIISAVELSQKIEKIRSEHKEGVEFEKV